MAKPDIPFTGPTYESESVFLSNQRCVNMYLRPYPELGQNKFALFGTPGLEEWVDIGVDAPVKNMLAYGDFLYVICGDILYTVSKAGTVTKIGLIGTLTDRVDLSTNGVDVTIVSGSVGYVYTLATGVIAQISDTDFPGGNNIIQVDGYYLVNNPGTGQVYRSDLNDGSSWDGLSFSTAGGNPDPIEALVADHRDAYLINSKSTEVWYNTGAAVFNFARAEGAYIEMGGVSNFARCRGNNAVYWLGQDVHGQGQVIQALGRQPKSISPYHVTRAINSYEDLSNSFMFSYQQDGHSFVVCQFPDDDATWVYDSTTGFWHERSSRIGPHNTDGRWRANCHAFFNNMNLVGDYANGKIYKLKPDVYDEDGEEMIAVRRSPVIRRNQSPITINEFQLVIEPGVGVSTGNSQDIDPHAMIRWSKDAGRNWSQYVDVSMGKIGETRTECKVQQLGQGMNWVFEYRVSAAVKRVILGAVAEVEYDGD